MGRSSVFSLEQIYRKQVVGTWSKIPEVFRYVNQTASITPTTGTDYGYLGGGRQDISGPWNATSVVDRIDFASDTSTSITKRQLNSWSCKIWII